MYSLIKLYCYFIFFCSLAISCCNKLIAIPKNSSFLILDYNSSAVIDGSNEYTRMHPASLTKLVTLYVLFDFIEEKKITLDTELIISKKASSMPASKLWLKAGETISVKDAINAMIVKSANDVSYAVAENLGSGNVKNFVSLMNKKVKELKLKNTHFENSTGLTNSKQYSTAYDMAIIAKYLMLRYPKYYHLFSKKTFTWKNHTYNTTNQLLNYSSVDGLKTGYTYAAGYNLLVSSEINGVRVIITSMGNPTSEIRDNIVRHLVDNGIILAQNYRFKQIMYKSPPNEIIIANNLLNTKINEKIASFPNSNPETASLYNNDTSEKMNLLVNDTKLNNKDSYLDLQPINEGKNMILVSNNNQSEGKFYNAVVTKTVKNNKLVNKKYFIQIGVYSNINNAKLAVNKALKIYPKLKQGLLLINHVKINNKYLYRVRICKFSQKDAYNLCNILKKKKISCFVGIDNT